MVSGCLKYDIKLRFANPVVPSSCWFETLKYFILLISSLDH